MPQRISIHFLTTKARILVRGSFTKAPIKHSVWMLNPRWHRQTTNADVCRTRRCLKNTKRVSCFDKLQESTLCRVQQWIQAGEKELMAELHVKSYKSSNSRCRLAPDPLSADISIIKYFANRISHYILRPRYPRPGKTYALFKSRCESMRGNRAIKSSHHKTLRVRKNV